MVRVIAGFAVLLAACGGSASVGDPATATTALVATTTTTASPSPSTTAAPAAGTTSAAGDDECAHVVGGTVEFGGSNATISATVRSADTGWEKYADRWEVRAPDGTVLGERILTHPHETEQPFTRSLGGVEIPGDLVEVILAAHDSVSGFCGDTFTLAIPERP